VVQPGGSSLVAGAERVGVDALAGKAFSTLHLPTLDRWPEVMESIGERFGLFLACDATDLSADVLAKAAERALSDGAVYVCAWGPGCERVHDAFDDAYVLLGVKADELPPVTTTWHADESLDEALWYFVDVAHPTGDPVTDWLAVSVGREDWRDRIRARLADLAGLRVAMERRCE
jgi:hypothetical protein